jgi:predicted HTH transcriptional regulator
MSISDDLIRQLVSRRESQTLDFKEKFYENSPEGNTELAKDVMAMANSLRNGESGYLLFGVAEDPVEHFGIIKGFTAPDWATDSNLQQKVRSLLNRLPTFSWSQVSVDGCLVGVIEICGGKRPFFPLKDGKNIKRYVTLHRVGSSTDVASPDEIIAWVREDEAQRGTIGPQESNVRFEVSLLPFGA